MRGDHNFLVFVNMQSDLPLDVFFRQVQNWHGLLMYDVNFLCASDQQLSERKSWQPINVSSCGVKHI